jgi:hypothetical protein
MVKGNPEGVQRRMGENDSQFQLFTTGKNMVY